MIGIQGFTPGLPNHNAQSLLEGELIKSTSNCIVSLPQPEQTSAHDLLINGGFWNISK